MTYAKRNRQSRVVCGTLPRMATGSKALPTTQEQQVSRAIEDERRRQGMSQARLAELVGISQPQMSRILAGTRAMTLSETIRACDALGLVASDVLREVGF